MDQYVTKPKIHIRTSIFQQVGLRNQSKLRPSEDFTYIQETADMVYIGLSDGKSGSKYGVLGGETCNKAIGHFIQDQGVDNLCNMRYPDELPYILTTVARNAIGELSFEHGAIFKEYASTLLSIAISPISGNYILIHIGDGCAICVLNDKSIKMLDPPEYCFTQPYTWLTTSATAANHVKVRMGNTKQMRRIILLSDGASTLCYGKNIRPKGVHLFAEEPFSSTLLYLQNHKSNDDVTCIFLDLKADLMAE